MDHIKVIFDRIKNESFPSEDEKKVLGIDLVEINSDTIKIISRFLESKGYLTLNEKKILENCLRDLKIVVPQLEQNEKQYFASLRQLANDTLEYVRIRNYTDNEVNIRHKWKIVYNQIKEIVNELDPLGVADVVDDEYDDLNFMIYSQLLKGNDFNNIFIEIKNKIEKEYSVKVSDNDIMKVIEKIKIIKIND